MTDALDEMRDAFAMLEQLPPPPKFDRIAVGDKRALVWLKAIPARRSVLTTLIVNPAVFGIPVVVDETVEVGVVEFRKGDELYKRFILAELRA